MTPRIAALQCRRIVCEDSNRLQVPRLLLTRLYVAGFPTCGETLAERYEQTMVRIERIKRLGYQVTIEWVSQKPEIAEQKSEILTHPSSGTHP